MPTLLSFFFILLTLFVSEILYFKIAAHFNIIDHPNERSSHTRVTLRGGGVIFSIASLFFFVFSGYEYPFFIIAVFIISIISFLDDVLTLNHKLRLTVHLISVLLLFYQWDLYHLTWYWLFIAGFFVIGTINAYNFMDGINGITGGYSLITFITLYYINNQVVNFTSNDLLIIVGLSLMVFNFFNFRKKAKCFAGDVGSVSIAFILTFLIGQLILQTHNFAYILLLLFYGLDTAITMFFRKIRKENLLEAHRSHFYQYLANQLKINHLMVSGFYMGIQLLMNVVLIFVVKDSMLLALTFTGLMSILFLVLRFKVEGKVYLLKGEV